MTSASDSEAREFAAAFRTFFDWVHSPGAMSERNEVVALVSDHLGEGAEHSVVARPLPVFEHVNLQKALDTWSRGPGREVAVHGFSLPPHYGPITLHQRLTGDHVPPLRSSAPALVDLPNGPSSTLACLQLGLLLVDDEHGRYVVMVRGPSEHTSRLSRWRSRDCRSTRHRRCRPGWRSCAARSTCIAGTCSTSALPGWASSNSSSGRSRRRCGTRSCCRRRCWVGWSGTPWASPVSILSAVCSCTGRPEPARPTRRAI